MTIIRDIAINAIGAFLGGFALLWVTLSPKGLKFLRSRLKRPSIDIEQRRTPENIFTALELGASAEWVREQLGAPTRVDENWWGYRFSDALVSLHFSTEKSVERIAVAITDSETHFDFPAWHFDCPPLGKITARDLLAVEHLEMQFNDSTRHSELKFTGREGPKGAWHYIAFGSLAPHYPGPILEPRFEWDKEKNRLITDPNDVLINWAAVSRSDKDLGFPWDFGLTI
ncbi:hypothetical protein [Burkholderia sp. KJ006]|uniref:hypothetical protein n=1 Tax=Burkholderia sp. KJ006 TaxID=416344 RepID=UPI000A023E62|nr:hypothetical protein [Burkholderia sp. KJ006]